jgi:hypothetical protein
MGYIIVLPQGVLTPKERAEAISREPMVDAAYI